MRVANPLRGEVTLPLVAGPQVLRPSFERLVAAEAELGSLVLLLDQAVTGAARLDQMEGLFWHCLEPPGEDREAFRGALMETGLGALLPPYRSLLGQVFRG